MLEMITLFAIGSLILYPEDKTEIQNIGRKHKRSENRIIKIGM